MGTTCQKNRSISVNISFEEQLPNVQPSLTANLSPRSAKEEYFEDGILMKDIEEIVIKHPKLNQKALRQICNLKQYGHLQLISKGEITSQQSTKKVRFSIPKCQKH